MNRLVLVSICFCCLVVYAQKSPSKGSPEDMSPILYEPDNTELLNKISAQLMEALAAVETMQEGQQFKVTEKRRNKFEFIRFGRK